jgi:hypothetical protein
MESWRTYQEQGIEAFLEHCTDDVVVEEHPGAPGAQAWVGKDGFLRMWQKWQEDLDDFAFAPVGEPQLLAKDVVAAPVRITGTGRLSGIDTDWHLVMVTFMRDGLIARQVLVDTLEEARALAR